MSVNARGYSAKKRQGSIRHGVRTNTPYRHTGITILSPQEPKVYYAYAILLYGLFLLRTNQPTNQPSASRYPGSLAHLTLLTNVPCIYQHVCAEYSVLVWMCTLSYHSSGMSISMRLQKYRVPTATDKLSHKRRSGLNIRVFQCFLSLDIGRRRNGTVPMGT